jgi:hypothetical protein
MKNILAKLFGWLFSGEQEELVGNSNVLVTKEEAYIPYRSEVLEKYLLSRDVDLKDPIDASVKIRKSFRATSDTSALKGNVDLKRSLTLKAKSNVVIANLRDFKLSEARLRVDSTFPDTILIINVTGKLSFTRNSKLELVGISPENVLINCTGSFSPSLMNNSELVGTIVTLKRLTILSNCRLNGETLGSEPNISRGTMVNKTTENFARLVKEREAELKKRKLNGGLDTIIK